MLVICGLTTLLTWPMPTEIAIQLYSLHMKDSFQQRNHLIDASLSVLLSQRDRTSLLSGVLNNKWEWGGLRERVLAGLWKHLKYVTYKYETFEGFWNEHSDFKYYEDVRLGTHVCSALGWVHESQVNMWDITVRI